MSKATQHAGPAARAAAKAKAKAAAAKKDGAKARKKGADAGKAEASWRCVHCGHRFDAADTPTRCPSCMRKGGLEQVQETSGGRPGWVVPAAVLAVVALAGVGYATLGGDEGRARGDGTVPLAPLSERALRSALEDADADVPEGDLLVADDAVEDLADEATGSDPIAKARALVAHVRERAAADAFVPWSLTQPRELPVKNAEWAASRLARDERTRLYPLELAAACVSALREADVDAMVAEISRFEDDPRPPDPSGYLGYFGVAVWPGEVGEGSPTVFDPYGGHAPEAAAEVRPLTDPQAVAAALATAAVHQLVRENEPVRALERLRPALRLDRRSPQVRGVRGAVLLASGGLEEGVRELEAARDIRPDGVRRNLLAMVFMAKGDVEQANRELAQALEAFPEYAAAHATLATIHLSRRETDLARSELQEAERIDPEYFLLKSLWAQYHLQTGDEEMAASLALEAVDARPWDVNTRLQASQIFRAAGRYDDMRRQARRALEMTPEDQRATFRERILTILGPTALEQPLDEIPDDELDLEEDEDEGLALDDPSGFQLGGDSSLLGGGGGGSLLGGGGGLLGDGDDDEGPSLLDGEDTLGGEGGGLQLGGSGSGGLQLRSP
ncbi:MAG: tetratricopeptide repeat protein, partial [Myxococcota bacterium]